MKKYFSLLVSVSASLLAFSLCAAEKLVSPDGAVKAVFDVRDGQPVFTLTYKDANVLEPSALGLNLQDAFRGGLALNDGTTFGGDGKGFMRLNFGCPRATLEEGMKRLLKAFK